MLPKHLSFLEANDLSPTPSSETTVPASRAFSQTRLRRIWPKGEASWRGLHHFPWELSGKSNEERHFAFIERLSSAVLKAAPQTLINSHTCEAGESGCPHFER